MSAVEKQRATVGLVLFVSFSFLGSWFVAASLRVLDLSFSPSPLGTRLFTTSLLYAITMGWQPILATWIVRRWVDPTDGLDLGLRGTRRIFTMVGCFTALAFALLAPLVGLLAAEIGLASASPLNGTAEMELASIPPSGRKALVVVLAFFGAIALVCIQALAEEVGWRGYFLTRAMQRLGKWRGLFAHGAVWGLWYAPVLFFTSYGLLDPLQSVSRALGFVVTCILLGTLLGWLRLASRSVVPAIMANTTLTLAAGLPYMIHGVDAGLRSSAVFGPAGWLLLLIAIGCLLRSSLTSAVQTPPDLVLAGGAPRPAIFRISIQPRPRSDRRDLN